MSNHRDAMGIKPHHLQANRVTTYWLKGDEKVTLEAGFPWFFADKND